MSHVAPKEQMPVWQEALLVIGTALVLAIVVKAFLVQAFYIPSGSMEPLMREDDKILVEKVSGWFGDIERGDVVVFDDPGSWLDEPPPSGNAVRRGFELVGLFPTGGHLIKRVIGVGGDTVTCCDDQGRLQVNGKPLDEPYVLDPSVTKDKPFSVEVPKGRLWVMGDNRGNSSDSRAHLGDPGGGFVPADEVVGKAWLRLWPLGRFGFV